MSYQQRIEQYRAKEDYYNIYPEDEVYIFDREDLDALLLAVQDEQKELCADNVFWESGKETDPDYMRESIIDAPLAYNPKPETA